MVDMHEPLMFLHNLDTTIKEPFASNPAVLDAVEKNHKKLQIAMTKLYPGNLVLSLSSGIMYHRLVDRITATSSPTASASVLSRFRPTEILSS